MRFLWLVCLPLLVLPACHSTGFPPRLVSKAGSGIVTQVRPLRWPGDPYLAQSYQRYKVTVALDTGRTVVGHEQVERPFAPAPGDHYGMAVRWKSRCWHNLSLKAREERALHQSLTRIEQQLAALSPEELIERIVKSGHFAPWNLAYLASRANRLVEAELSKRGESARSTLEAHRDDTRPVYTGPSGEFGYKIGEMCDRLLAKLTPRGASNPGMERASER